MKYSANCCCWHVIIGAGDTKTIMQSQVALVQCVKAFVRLHNESVWMSWSSISVDIVLKWMLNSVRDTQLQQVCSVLYTNRKAVSQSVLGINL